MRPASCSLQDARAHPGGSRPWVTLLAVSSWNVYWLFCLGFQPNPLGFTCLSPRPSSLPPPDAYLALPRESSRFLFLDCLFPCSPGSKPFPLSTHLRVLFCPSFQTSQVCSCSSFPLPVTGVTPSEPSQWASLDGHWCPCGEDPKYLTHWNHNEVSHSVF